jgi:hypothetical protein
LDISACFEVSYLGNWQDYKLLEEIPLNQQRYGLELWLKNILKYFRLHILHLLNMLETRETKQSENVF